LNAIQHDYNQISTKLEVELKTLEDTKDKMNSNKVVFNRDSYLYCFFQNQYLAAKSLEIHDMLRLNNRWSEAEQFIEKNPECLSIIDEKVSYNTKTNGVHTIVSIRLLLKSFSAVAALTNFPSK
jgi:Mg2+ and Co2+ transporter CorA